MCLWIRSGVSTADEPHAIRLIRNFPTRRGLSGHEVKHPRRSLSGGPRPTRAENCPALRENLCLHKQIAEGRVQCVSGRSRQNDFRITGHIDHAACP